MDTDEARAATSPEGLALLSDLPPYTADGALNRGASLRAAGVAPSLAAAVMTQARLRERARAKFGDFADGMLFTPEGLEQATRLTVAALHAERFRSAGIGRVADLTAGIGADAMAMSAIGIAVMAFETNEATALIADHNLRHWKQSVVVHADSLATVR
ncbi:MAG TPA: SAM-dependent methyltransferase, partial [Demequinaceae bacterium]